MKKKVKCFNEVLDKTRPYTMMGQGIRVIEVKRITGTVGKCGELDIKFQYIKRHDHRETSRRFQISQVVKSYKYLPSIEAYYYQGEYYVIDGNRRVATAIAMGVEFIDAHVTEIVYKNDKDAISGVISRRRFESETGLKNISLNYETGYTSLLQEVFSSSDDKDIKKKAGRWYSEVYLPFCKLIRRSILPKRYPKLRTSDIFVLITNFYNEFMGGIPEGAGFQTLISGFMFAHKIPDRRPFRLLPFRVIYSIIIGKRRKRRYLPQYKGKI